MPLVVGSGITVETGITIESSNTPLFGTGVAWLSNTYLDFWTSRSGVQSTNPLSVGPFQGWQLCYAWQSVSVANGTSTLGFNAWSNSISPVNWWLSIATAPNVINFATSQTISSTSGTLTYPAGAFVENTPDSAVDFFNGYVVQGPVTIPANTYFMIGLFGASYRTYKPSQNRTALVGTTPYVTVLNTVYLSIDSAPNQAAAGVIPAAVGGTAPTSGYFITYPNTVQVMSAKFRY